MDSQADSHSIVSSQNRAQQVQIPSKNWMEPYLPIAAVLLLALILRSWTLFCGTNVDEGDYLMQGREWMRGHLPYLDVHLNKPPLVSILSFPFFLFSSVPIVPVRIFMILFSISSIFAIWLLGRELRDEKTGLFAACWLAFDPYSAIWAKALHVSTLAPELSIWALALFTIGRRRNQALYMTLAGLFSALCILNKQTGVTILPILALAGFFLWRKKVHCQEPDVVLGRISTSIDSSIDCDRLDWGDGAFFLRSDRGQHRDGWILSLHTAGPVDGIPDDRAF